MPNRFLPTREVDAAIQGAVERVEARTPCGPRAPVPGHPSPGHPSPEDPYKPHAFRDSSGHGWTLGAGTCALCGSPEGDFIHDWNKFVIHEGR